MPSCFEMHSKLEKKSHQAFPKLLPWPPALMHCFYPWELGLGTEAARFRQSEATSVSSTLKGLSSVRWTGGIICGHNHICLTFKKLPEGVMQCPVNILEMDFQAGAVGLVPGFPPIWWSHLEKRLTGLVSLLHSQWSKCPFIFIHCF